MTDPRLDFLDRLQAATKERMQRVDQVVEQVATISGEATSSNQLVTVKVSPNGALLELVLDDEATDLDARELAALIVATARTATQRAAAALQDVITPLEGPLDVQAGPLSPAEDSSPAAPRGDSTAFDAALDRADRVAEAVEDRLRGLDSGPR